SATVTVTVIDVQACQPSPGNISSIKVNPSKGPGGKTVGITATVDRRLAACPFRLFLGGALLGPDIPAGPDGSITAEREVPKDAKPGPSILRLTTMRAQTVAEGPFQVVPPDPLWLRLLRRLLIGAGALVAGALARAAFRPWRPPPGVRGRRGARARHHPDLHRPAGTPSRPRQPNPPGDEPMTITAATHPLTVSGFLFGEDQDTEQALAQALP